MPRLRAGGSTPATAWRRAIKDQRAADDTDPCVEVTAPEAVAQENDARRARPPLLRAEEPSGHWLEAEGRGQVGGGANDAHPLGQVVLAHRGRVVAEGDELVDGSRACRPVEEVWHRRAGERDAAGHPDCA
jgi:hypothetical protein